MEIILKKLKLTGFKKLTGEWGLNSKKNMFSGENGTGKTTLFDAECWVRTGRDSRGKANFNIKTIIDGASVNNTDHGVKTVYLIDGEELTLERVYKERWTKRRGRSEREFDGHETLYRLDNKAKTSKRQFDAKVKEVFGGETFQLCSKPGYFAALPWERRREILTEIAGETNKDEIINAIDGFRQILGENSPDEQNKLSKERRRQINEDLKTLPARIDELRRQIPEESMSISPEEARGNIEEAEKAEVLARSDISRLKEDAASDISKKIGDLYQELRNAQTAFEDENADRHAAANKKRARITLLNADIKTYDREVGRHERELENLTAEYKRIKAAKYSKSSNSCRYCGEVIFCAHCGETDEEKAEKKFNSDKSARLGEIESIGREAKQNMNTAKEKIEELKKELSELSEGEEQEVISFEQSSESVRIHAEIEELESQRKEKMSAKPPEELVKKHEAAEAALSDKRRIVAELEASAKARARIKELEEKRESISSEFDELEEFFYLFDQYNKAVAEQTEDRANQLFDSVRFKMFEQQINGSIIPCCVITDDQGRPYETAMSTGERIRADLDIIRTLSTHYQVFAPVFIDHAESITSELKLDCQTIELRAVEGIKELKQT